MTDLQYILKTIKSREKEEQGRLERTEKFNGIRRKERERVLNLLTQKAVLKHKRYMKNLNQYIIFEEDLKQIIEELKGEN